MRIAAFSAAILVAFYLTNAGAQEQAFPSRPVRLIVANSAGSPPDNVGRLVAAKLTEIWGQQVVVDNRAGASGLIAAETVVRSAPDGYTLWLPTLTQLIASLQAQRYILGKTFAPITLVAGTPHVILANASLPVKSIADLIAYAKARPGKMTFGSAGQWGTPHLCMESFMSQAGIQMLHVPFKGSTPAQIDLMAGRIDVYCSASPAVPAMTQTGKVRALGVTYQKPTALMPGVAPVADTIRGFEVLGWYSLQAPLATPKRLVARINADMVKALKSPDLQEKLFALGAEAAPMTPEELAAFLQRETVRWDKTLRQLGGIQ